MLRILLILTGFLLPVPFAWSALNPVTFENRKTRPATDESKTIIVDGGMVWLDARVPSRGMRFPEGTYTLEAEDDDYWYFRAPTDLEFRTFKGHDVAEVKMIPGGLMLGKRRLKLVPAGGYIDGDSITGKIMDWKLGRVFLRLEGKDWKRNFAK